MSRLTFMDMLLTNNMFSDEYRNALNGNFTKFNQNIEGMLTIEQLAEIAQNDSFNATQTADSAKAESTQAAQNASAALQYNVGKWLAPVATFDDIATTYPSPEDNDRVQVRDTGRAYVRLNNAWEWFSEITAGPVNEVDDRLSGLITNRVEILDTEIVYTVGSTGDFQTINEALETLTKKYPSYKFNSESIGITLLLKSGFVMAEQVFISNLNLSHISVKSEDAEVVIDRQALSVPLGSVARYPAWAFTDGAISPKIYVLFNMNTTGLAEQRNGFNARLGSTVLLQPGAGCKNAGGRGLHLAFGFGYANGCNFSGAGNAAVRVANGGRLFGDGMDLSNSLNGILADEGYATARGSDASGCTIAIRAIRSTIDFKESVATGCGTVVSAEEFAEVTLTNGDFKGFTKNGILATRSARVFADFTDFSGGTGTTLNINDSEVSAKLANLLTSTDFSLSSTTSKVNITQCQIKKVALAHGSHVNARNTTVDSSVVGNCFSLSGRGNSLIIDGTTGTVGLPVNQVVSSGIIYQ